MSTIRNFLIVQKEGNREVTRKINFYNLDAIIAVGYRVNSKQATQFRIWATNVLNELITKGFVLDDDLLKKTVPALVRITSTNYWKRSVKSGPVNVDSTRK